MMLSGAGGMYKRMASGTSWLLKLMGSVEGLSRKNEWSLDNRVNGASLSLRIHPPAIVLISIGNPFIPTDIPLPEFQLIKQILKNHQHPSSSTELDAVPP